jgi:DNA gyrase inhibitor GyrI
LSETPEEDAWKKIVAWAKPRGMLEKSAGTRVFGRNTYPTNNPEPHGYEFFLTVGPKAEPEGDIKIKNIPGGLYAVLRFENLENMGKAWRDLWEWIEKSGYDHIGWQKGENGWFNGFEEHLNWHENKPTIEWIFDLWVQLKE